MPRSKPLKPGRYHKLTVIGATGRLSPKGGCMLYACVCDCGKELEVESNKLRRGTKKSCGCAFKSMVADATRTHGLSRTPEHKVWCGMLRRCNNKNEERYGDYGGRGIKVCERWSGKQGFANFLEDMGKRPSPKHEIDRKDNDLGYFKENCRWATRKQNSRNRRNNVMLEFRGETFCLSEWAERLDMDKESLKQRHYLGWSAERILTTPTRKRFAS